MKDYDLPELPSDQELGITEEDRRSAAPEERPELSKEERAALLGDEPGSKRGGGPKEPGGEKPPEGPGGPAPAKAARVPEPAGPRSRWRGPVTLAFLVVTAAVASTRTGLPTPVPANASDSVFSSSRAMSMLIELARLPHPTGSPEHARVREYLVDRLRSLGLEPEVQVATSMIERAPAARVATVRNVVARIPGTAPTGAILVTAHYDSRELSPGAADDGSGVVAILEAIRALGTGEPLRNDVIVLFTDAEELGMMGARAFADQHPWMADVQVVLSFEMRGAAGPSVMFETGENNGWIVRALREFDPSPFANSLAGAVYARMPNDTDFSIFRVAGEQGLNFAAVDRARVYHQATDRPENLSEATLQHHGVRALAALRWLGQADLTSVNAPDVVYFSVPVLGLVVYGRGWVLPIAGGLLALFLLALFAALRRGARPGALLAGLGVALLGAAAAYGAGIALLRWAMPRHPEAGSLAAAAFHAEGWYVLGLVAVTVTVVTGLYALARRWISALEMSLAAAVVPVLLATWLALTLPAGAMNLQWPAAAALLGALVLALLGARAGGHVAWAATLLLAVPVLFLLVPVTELLWLALTLGVAAPLGALVAIGLHLCTPALDGLRHPNGWWAPALSLAVGAAALGFGALGARTSPERPAPSTLLYAYEHGTGSAVWATDPAADDELDAQAIAWAAQRVAAPFAATRDLNDFGYAASAAPVAPAPLAQAPPPDVRVLSDTIEGSERRVTLGVRSRVGAELLRFQVDTLGRTTILSVSGHELDSPGRVRVVEHWGVPDSLVVLRLRMPADEPIGLHVVEHLLRPGELLGDDRFARPPTLVPDYSTLSDRAMLRYSVAAFADPRHAFMPQPGGAEGPGAGTAPAPPGDTAAPPGADSPAAAPPEPADAPDGTPPETAPPASSEPAAPVPSGAAPRGAADTWPPSAPGGT
ncbi:MAG TPA: M20/M25/M40 family metallo-hydrolase [Longimicrobiales bacterium]|nr:M20/M25/M40 family metallo-hydrolase [Longimicrobiales bacterium]